MQLRSADDPLNKIQHEVESENFILSSSSFDGIWALISHELKHIRRACVEQNDHFQSTSIPVVDSMLNTREDPISLAIKFMSFRLILKGTDTDRDMMIKHIRRLGKEIIIMLRVKHKFIAEELRRCSSIIKTTKTSDIAVINTLKELDKTIESLTEGLTLIITDVKITNY